MWKGIGFIAKNLFNASRFLGATTALALTLYD
jgi:hypothetical protein